MKKLISLSAIIALAATMTTIPTTVQASAAAVETPILSDTNEVMPQEYLTTLLTQTEAICHLDMMDFIEMRRQVRSLSPEEVTNLQAEFANWMLIQVDKTTYGNERETADFKKAFSKEVILSLLEERPAVEEVFLNWVHDYMGFPRRFSLEFVDKNDENYSFYTDSLAELRLVVSELLANNQIPAGRQQILMNGDAVHFTVISSEIKNVSVAKWEKSVLFPFENKSGIAKTLTDMDYNHNGTLDMLDLMIAIREDLPILSYNGSLESAIMMK